MPSAPDGQAKYEPSTADDAVGSVTIVVPDDPGAVAARAFHRPQPAGEHRPRPYNRTRLLVAKALRAADGGATAEEIAALAEGRLDVLRIALAERGVPALAHALAHLQPETALLPPKDGGLPIRRSAHIHGCWWVSTRRKWTW